MGLNQREMAELGSVSRPTYRLYEENRREPSLGFILRIVENGIDPLTLLFGREIPYPPEGTVCITKPNLGILFDLVWEIHVREHDGKLPRSKRRALFVDTCNRLTTPENPSTFKPDTLTRYLADMNNEL